MKQICFIFWLSNVYLICFISQIQSCDDEQGCFYGKTKSNLKRYQYGDDDDDDSSSEELTTNARMHYMSDFSASNPPVPDFSRPGQRISVTKCYEYIWEMSVRRERRRRYEIYSFGLPKIPYLVIGGRFTEEKKYAHMGAVGWISNSSLVPWLEWKFMCGCTLISSKFVLTAAHCTYAPGGAEVKDKTPKIVRFGATLIDRTINYGFYKAPEDNKIARIIVHEKYASPLQYYDIALFELDKTVTFSVYVQPSCLWTDELDDIKHVEVTGWGVTDVDLRTVSPLLMHAQLDIIDTELCNSLLMPHYNRKWNGTRDHQFCAGQLKGGVDVCQGDSGGPVQIPLPLPIEDWNDVGAMHYIVGVTSFGIKCGKENTPGVFTKTEPFLDWIERNVWG